MIQRTPKFLMANLSAEVERIFYWKEKKDTKMLEETHARAQKIIDQILTCPEMISRKKEIEVLSEVINDLIGNSQKYHNSTESIRGYFLPFVQSFVKI